MVIFTENSSLAASMLCSLAREHGWEVDICFAPPQDKDGSQVKLFIEQYKPDLLGFSFKSWERSQALSLAETMRHAVNTKIIAGGIHPTLMPDEIVQTGFFDAVVVGDGMGVWENILDEYKNLNGEIICGKQHPNRHLYNRHFHSKSQIERMRATEMATVLTAMGCPYKCTFCHSGSKKFLFFPFDSLIEYVLELHDKYGVGSFHFVDDLFASDSKKLGRFRKTIEQSGKSIVFSSQVTGRASSFNTNVAAELVKLGVETINFGIETASPKLLKFLNKKQTVEDSYSAVQVCHEFGLNCVINLMFGIPTQDEDNYKDTLEFVEKARPDSVNCFFYSPYPGTELYDYCFDNQYLPESFDRNRFDWFKPEMGGTTDIQLRLNKVDYEVANQYMGKINQVLARDEVLFERMKIIDLHPWVLVGTTRHYYFITLMKKLSGYSWKNCLGYINMDIEAGFLLDDKSILLPQYNIKTNRIPFWGVTYSFLGSDYKIVERYVKGKFGSDTPLISISSFRKSHNVTEIKDFLKDRYARINSENVKK